MTSMDKLAQLFRDRDNQFVVNITTGLILSIAPIKIKWGDGIILEQDKLIFSNQLINAHQRQCEVNGQIVFSQSNAGIAKDNGLHDHQYSGSPTSSNGTHDHSVDLSVNTDYQSEATIQFSDTLKIGDEVIMLPDNDFKTWYVIDKAVRL